MRVKILGIDPGTIVTGYACIDLVEQSMKAVDLGVVRPPRSQRLSARYHVIFQSIQALIEKFRPTHLAVETPFVQKNIQSALKLGGAVSCILVAACEHGLETYGYSPAEVKKGVFGRGSATKDEIQRYLTRLLQLDAMLFSHLDATDALAVAVHHGQKMTTTRRPQSDAESKLL